MLAVDRALAEAEKRALTDPRSQVDKYRTLSHAARGERVRGEGGRRTFRFVVGVLAYVKWQFQAPHASSMCSTNTMRRSFFVGT